MASLGGSGLKCKSDEIFVAGFLFALGREQRIGIK